MSTVEPIRNYYSLIQAQDRRASKTPQSEPPPVPEGRPYTDDEWMDRVRWKLREPIDD